MKKEKMLTWEEVKTQENIVKEIVRELKRLKGTSSHTCKKRGIAGIYPRKFFWIFRKIIG